MGIRAAAHFLSAGVIVSTSVVIAWMAVNWLGLAGPPLRLAPLDPLASLFPLY